jgi:hypothetical protein
VPVGPYDGLHAFVFMSHADPGANYREIVSSLSELDQVLFAAELVGSFRGFAHVNVESLPELQDLMANELWEAGVRSQWSTELEYYVQPGVSPQPMGPKRNSPTYCALVRVRVAHGHMVRDVLQELGGEGALSTFQGASIVSGRGCDILLELGAEEFDPASDSDPIKRTLLEEIPGIQGVGSTDTSFTYVGAGSSGA